MRWLSTILDVMLGIVSGGDRACESPLPPEPACTAFCDDTMQYWCDLFEYVGQTHGPQPGGMTGPLGYFPCTYIASADTWIGVECPWMCLDPDPSVCCFSFCLDWRTWRGDDDRDGDGDVDLRDFAEAQRSVGVMP